MSVDRSRSLMERARRVIPGGVNSPVRAFEGVRGTPPFIRSGSGAFLEDVDGKRYLDLVGSWGVMILGHAHPEVRAALAVVLEGSTSFGAPTSGEDAVTDWSSSAAADAERFKTLFHGLLERGIHLPPSPFEGWFWSVAHTEDDMERVMRAIEDVLTTDGGSGA